MIELWNEYNETIITFIGYVAVVIPFLRGRAINDKNILKIWETAKNAIKENNSLKVNFNQAINGVKNEIERIDRMVCLNLAEVNGAITNFIESELYSKMLVGLGELDDLHQLLLQKDTTIEMLQTELKENKKALQEILNELRK